MTLEVLVSTMNQTDKTLLDRINLQSDAVVVNQCNHYDNEEFYYKGHHVRWISMKERGIGLSRNTALLNAKADIVLFADDDITYQSGYSENVLEAFAANRTADIVCFNINLLNSNKNIGTHRNNTCNKRLYVYNSMRYGATLIAARRKALYRERLSFSMLFGGGAEFNSGEDSVFIKDCLDAGLKMFSNVYCLGNVEDSHSSWFTGIDDKFFIDRGIVYATAFKRYYPIIFVYYALRLSGINHDYNALDIIRLFNRGKHIIREYR